MEGEGRAQSLSRFVLPITTSYYNCQLQHGGATGAFPSNYVEPLPPAPVRTLGEGEPMNPLNHATHFDVQWYWEEDAANLDKHDPTMVLPGSTFVQYSHAVSNELEDAHQARVIRGGGFKAGRSSAKDAKSAH